MPTIPDVKPVTFERFDVSADGEMVIFEVHDKLGNKGHISLNWLNLSSAIQLIVSGAEKAAKARKSLGKSDLFDGSGALKAQMVTTFQVSEVSDHNLLILTLQSPAGFRSDFAIPTDTTDQLGRSYPQAIAEELLSGVSGKPQTQH